MSRPISPPRWPLMRLDAPVLLYGAGREARSTRTFLARRAPDLKVYVTADSGETDIDSAEFIASGDLEKAIDDRRFATIVKSPGVSRLKPLLARARTAGIDITSNLNLWGETYRTGKTVIAVTGTKGKSTTATLVHAMLVEAGIDAGLAGNVGVPPLDIADRHPTIVFELSSYQTADIAFAPDIAALTTLFPEHLDWHGSLQAYYADKLRLLTLSPETRLAIGPQAATMPPVQALVCKPERLIPALGPALEDEIFDIGTGARLKGQHNIDNAILAARIAIECGATDEDILAAIAAFHPLPHRLEEHAVGTKTIVDDSISTTPEATKAALAAYFGHRIALIAGGYDRGQTYDDLAEHMARQDVRVVACLPDTGTRLANALRVRFPQASVIEAADLEHAMRALQTRQSQFDTLILSPGAPSYNQFRNFEERGDAFVALARALFS